LFIFAIFWVLFNFGAVFGYWVAPTFKGRSPRWATGMLFMFTALFAIRFCIDIWSLRTGCGQPSKVVSPGSRKRLPRLLLCVWTLSGLFFFFLALDLGACLHAGCGPDWQWSGANVVIDLIWLGFLASKDSHANYKEA